MLASDGFFVKTSGLCLDALGRSMCLDEMSGDCGGVRLGGGGGLLLEVEYAGSILLLLMDNLFPSDYTYWCVAYGGMEATLTNALTAHLYFFITATMSIIPSRNSKELKVPPNNINININFTMKDAMAQALPQQPLPAKPLAGKKIDNYVHISSGGRGEARRANVTTETLKDRRRELLDEQDSSNALGEAAELLKTKRLDAPQVKPTKRKERSAKVSQTHQEVMQSVFSTNKLKNKQYSRELREMFARGHEPQGYLNAGIPTPTKNLSAEKTRRKSAERERIKRKQSAEKSRGADQWKLSKSVENLNKHKVFKGYNRTPSRSKSKSSGSKGSSTKRKTIHVDPRTDRTRQSGNHNIVLARRS